ncbi:hypothetical protein BCR33DRAFT_39824 [Rhizoclosmatium globosum]|uniref:UspA domain-containing protein n=1 Tax=Rhizoclosmatium globosum TaxID=329046 RepID=A0A1Y2CQI0_9FUNG|nr:hypothetical protein BCR33DRAFT_39824 [Rhizoclosmatium globosum]|eukprot:ORY48605.1 hypothetical protein BCR33DRAFT_39824 [Rhizoclosmatium globosum]
MIEDDNKKSSHGFLKTQIEVLANHAIPAKGLALRGDPRRSIIRTIYELDADLLILGPHHQENAVSLPVSAGKRGLGSVSDYVLRNAACSVLIAKEKQMVPSWRAL